MKSKQLIANLRGKVYVSLNSPAEMTEEREMKLITLTKELGKFGYSLSPKALMYLSDSDMTDIINETLPYLQEQFYPGTKWCPLYPGFPEQVISKTEKELWDEQHELYASMKKDGDGPVDYSKFIEKNSWYTDSELNDLLKASEDRGHDRQEYGAMTEADLLGVFKSILSSGNSLHAETREELVWFLENYPDEKLPEKIPFKETMCVVMKYRPDYSVNDVNDVLRYGIYLMGGNPELVKVPKKVASTSWKKRADVNNPQWRALSATRKVRADILSRLNNVVEKRGVEACIPDAKRFYGHWYVLSERVHPGDYETKFPKAFSFISILKSNAASKMYRTWNSILQEKYDKGEDVLSIAKFASARPGEFIRRFDSFLRRGMKDGRESDVMDIFIETSGMKNKTLLELRNYYEKRAARCPRLISVKGKTTKHLIDPLDPLPVEMVNTVREFIERKVLLNIKDSVTEKDLLGKTVYIDPEINHIPIPMGMRDNVFVIPQCTRTSIPEDKNFIRMFIHWIQKPGKPEDLDLHAYLYKDDQTVSNVGWNTTLKSGDCVVHSGDVLNRDGDCSEYVDIDINKAIESGWNYIVMDVHNYKGRGFDTLDNWLGYTTSIERLEPGNKNWVPKNIDFSQKISVNDSSIAAWIFDLNKRQAILIGVGLSGIPINRGNQNATLIKFFAEEPKFTCYDVVCQYYKSRGANIISDISTEHDVEVTKDEIAKDYTKVLEILG